MINYCLLRLENGGNKEVAHIKCNDKAHAIEFLAGVSGLNLNANGYLKINNTSWCVSEEFDPQASNYKK